MSATIIPTCRVCAESIRFQPGKRLAACPVCGALNDLPRAAGDALATLNQAHRQRAAEDFLSAELSYQQVLREYPDEHTALLGLALCRFGVCSVRSAGGMMSVIRNMRRSSMRDDVDFRLACESAPQEIRGQYMELARYVDEVRDQVIRLAAQKQSYDVFICCRNLQPETNSFTADHERASSLSRQLQAMGWRVFYAPEMLDRVGSGASYDGHVIRALETARVMLVVCSGPEALEQADVRHEWTQFLEQCDEDDRKLLLPLLYEGMTSADLPLLMRRRGLWTLDMTSDSALKELIREVKTAVSGAGEEQEPTALHAVSEAAAETPRLAERAMQETPHASPAYDLPAIATICQRCKAQLEIPAGQQLVTCQYCEMCNARPVSKGVEQQMLQRAKKELLSGHFSEAEKDFREILLKHPNEHEALWGRLLSRYGVEYVKDTYTGELRPTVHFTHLDVIQTESDFKEACELAPPLVAEQYRRDAAYIDKVQAKIRAKVQNDPGFDVFICHKTTKCTGPDDGSQKDEYTRDYKQARDLFDELKKRRYRTFFAPQEGLTAGADYEAGIYHALDSSRVLLLVCLTHEYLNTAWVRSEWSRFLDMQKRDPGKQLVPLYYDGVQEWQLPEEIRLRKLQGIRMGELRSLEELLGTLEKYIGKPVVYSPEEDFEILQTGSGCEILHYVGHDAQIVVPQSIRGYAVCGVSKRAFAGCTTMTELTLPEGVAYVGDHAFEGCTALSAVILPESLAVLGQGVFRSCGALRKIRIVPENGHYELRAGVLFSRDGMLLCHPAGLPAEEYNVPEGVRGIGAYAFFGCACLRRVTVPQSVERIGDRAFEGCVRLGEVRLPAAEPEMGKDVFAGCPELVNRDFQTDSDGMGGLILKKYTGRQSEVEVPSRIGSHQVTAIGERAFRDCSSLTGIILPQSVRSIGLRAFENCHSLMHVTLPEGLTSIGEEAFMACISLRELALPDTLRQIGDGCFSYCGLRALRIPAGVTGFSDHTLRDCRSLTNLELLPDQVQISEVLLRYCPQVTLRVRRDSASRKLAEKLRIPYTEIFSPEKDFDAEKLPDGCVITKYRGDEQEVVVPPVIRGDEVRELGAFAFSGCRTLRSIRLPEGVTALGLSVFYNCGSLQQVYLPRSLTQINWRAFGYCSSLKRLSIPGSVTRINKDAFEGSGMLTICGDADSKAESFAREHGYSFELRAAPESDFEFDAETHSIVSYCGNAARLIVPGAIGGNAVWSIGQGAFRNQTCIESVVLLEIVTIDDEAFSGCSSLREVSFPQKTVAFGSRVFENCAALESLTLPAMTEIGKGFCSGCVKLQSVKLPKQLTEVRERAFADCRSLREIQLPDGLLVIGRQAFAGCSQLAETEISCSVRLIADDAFDGCSALKLRVHSESEGEQFVKRTGVPAEVIVHYTDEKLFTVHNAGQGCTLMSFAGKNARVLIPPVMKGRAVTAISKEAFRNTQTVSEIVIPEGVTKIGGNAFDGCSALERIVIPASMKEISNTAFRRCGSLREVAVAQGNADYSMKDGMLLDKNGVLVRFMPGCGTKNLKIPEAVRRIGPYAFEDCAALSRIDIPRQVESIGSNAFEGCTATLRVPVDSPAHLYLEEKEIPCEVVGRRKQPRPAASTTSPVPASGEEFEAMSMPGGCAVIRYHGSGGDVTVPHTVWNDTVKMIGVSAFAGSLTLRRVTLPESVESIAGRAFADCTALESAFIPSGVSSIAEDAFNGCGKVTLYGCPGSEAERFARRKRISFVAVGGQKEPEKPEGRKPYVVSAWRDGCALTRYMGEDTNVSVPEKVDGKTLLCIGQGAFEGLRKVVSVTLPGTVLRIENDAFKGCAALKSVYMPPSILQIGAGAFVGSNQAVLYGVAGSEAERFANAASLLFVPVGQQSAASPEKPRKPQAPAGEFRFESSAQQVDCHITRYTGSETDVTVPDSIGGKPVRRIGVHAFSGSDVYRVTLPPTLERICTEAFADCPHLKEVRVPRSLKQIGENAFGGNQGVKVLWYSDDIAKAREDSQRLALAMPRKPLKGTAAANAAQKPSYTSADDFTTTALPGGCAITGYSGSASIVRIPPKVGNKEVWQIAENAFKGNQTIREIHLPESVTQVCAEAFADCPELRVVTMPGVVKLSPGAFRNCGALREVLKTGNLREIGSRTFQCCHKLTTISFSESLKKVEGYAFNECGALKRIHIPAGVESIGENAFEDCKALSEIQIDYGVRSIGGWCFKNCTALGKVTLPASVTQTGMFLFSRCSSLQTAILNCRITQLEEYTFSDCVKLTDVSLPDTLTSVAAHAFDGCSSLETLTIPAGVKSYGQNAFDGCTKLPAEIRARSANTMLGRLGKKIFG